jgi:hypothetical protein
MMVVPVYVLMPERVSVPVPSLVRLVAAPESGVLMVSAAV